MIKTFLLISLLQTNQQAFFSVSFLVRKKKTSRCPKLKLCNKKFLQSERYKRDTSKSHSDILKTLLSWSDNTLQNVFKESEVSKNNKGAHLNAEWAAGNVSPATTASCKRHHLWLSSLLILRLIWPPPKPREAYEVITRVKSYCATETDVQGGKKSWQKISVVSLERICKWEGRGREQGEDRRAGRRVKQELGLKRKRKDSKKKIFRR